MEYVLKGSTPRQSHYKIEMELIYLLASIVSTSVSSLLHSVILFFRRIPIPRAVAADVALYEGTVWHERRRPVHHSFQYHVRYALVDLDYATTVPADHLFGDEARGVSETNGRVLLLTIPASVGYQQNPLSLYYCYDVEGDLKKCIAEVTNTPWGERVLFLFNPNSDTVAKPLHVSPFMDMMGSWTIQANSPEENLSVAICVEHPELGNYFTATLRAKRISTEVAGDPAWFFWLMPHKVAIWIYWHAIMLWWKGVPFIQHPRYHIPEYKQQALSRDNKLQSNQQAVASCTYSRVAEKSRNPRCFTWRDAKWPWC